jgi:hypothetical protein
LATTCASSRRPLTRTFPSRPGLTRPFFFSNASYSYISRYSSCFFRYSISYNRLAKLRFSLFRLGVASIVPIWKAMLCPACTNEPDSLALSLLLELG